MCNRAGPAFPGDPPLPSPRYADCQSAGAARNASCTGGPNADNCVSPQLNALAANASQDPDAFAVWKEQALGAACAVPGRAFFWTSMLKSGNYYDNTTLCKPPYPPRCSAHAHP